MASNRFRGVLLAALVVLAAACSAAPQAADPAGTVRDALSAVSTGGIGKLADFTCAAKKGDPLSILGASTVDSLGEAGIKPADLIAAMSMTVANVVTTEKVKTATAATVHVTADSVVTMDKDKMRAIMKTVLATQGKPTDDKTLDFVMNAMSASLTKSQKIDEDIELVNEGGKWLVCE
jgi:hypothetical protein